MQADFCKYYGPPPTYIKRILQNEDPIVLIYQKPKLEDEMEQTCHQETALDLTGNPLLVDLNYYCDLSIMPKLNPWNEFELNHFPLKLSDARKIINEFNNNKNANASPVYCICDGSDNKQTVILGSLVLPTESARKFSRIVITVEGCFSENDPRLGLNYMQNEHQQAVNNSTSKLETVVTNNYVLYGSNLKNYAALKDAEFSSSIHAQVSWDKLQCEPPPYVKFTQITLQIIVGHKDSKLYNYWKELHFLNTCVSILQNRADNIEQIEISSEPEVYTKIITDLVEVLNTCNIKKAIPRHDVPQLELNVDHLRDYNLLDKLWIILTRCHKVVDLKICLQSFFEELADSNVNVSLPDDNSVVIAEIINKLCAGKIAVPTLPPAQALEYLIELGIEKLKNDYHYILDYFDSLVSGKLIRNYWNKIAELRETTYEELHTPLYHNHLREIVKKYNFLTQLHKALEFLFLAEYFISVNKEVFDSIRQSIVNQCLNFDETADEFQVMLPLQLHELKICLNSTNSSFLKGVNPISRNLKMSTNNKSHGVITTFHHSNQPVFPPSIFNSYGNVQEDLVFYCYKSVTYWSYVK